MTVQTTTAIDMLSYATVTMKGHACQPVTIALTNGPDQPTAPLARVTGDFDLRLSLKPVFSRRDPTHVATIGFEGTSGETTLSLDHFLLERMSTMSVARHTEGFGSGITMPRWRTPKPSYKTVCAQESPECSCKCPTRMIRPVSGPRMPRCWNVALNPTLKLFALDGYPEAIYEPAPLIEKDCTITHLLLDGNWAGNQLDIEPSLLAQFYDPQD